MKDGLKGLYKMKLTPEEREQLRQMFLIDVDVNLDRLIVLTENDLAKKYDEEIVRVKEGILTLIEDTGTKKEIDRLFSKKLIPGNSIGR